MQLYKYLAVIKFAPDNRLRLSVYRHFKDERMKHSRIRLFTYRSVSNFFKDGPDASIAELICHLLTTVRDDKSLKIVGTSEVLTNWIKKILSDDYDKFTIKETLINRKYINQLKPLHHLIIEDDDGNEIVLPSEK